MYNLLQYSIAFPILLLPTITTWGSQNEPKERKKRNGVHQKKFPKSGIRRKKDEQQQTKNYRHQFLRRRTYKKQNYGGDDSSSMSK